MSAAPADSDGPIGLLGGTFDPVHHGHLRVALEAFELLRLAQVRLIPLNQPSHRAVAVASVVDRCDMLAAALHPPLVLDRSEIERGGLSYTVDTLEHVRDRFPRRSLCLLMGLDAYRLLPTWHRAADLLKLAHIVVAARPEVEAQAAPGLDELIGNAQSEQVADLHDSLSGRVFFLDIPLLPIASSDLRARRRNGRSVRYLVPDAVEEMICQRELYLT